MHIILCEKTEFEDLLLWDLFEKFTYNLNLPDDLVNQTGRYYIDTQVKVVNVLFKFILVQLVLVLTKFIFYIYLYKVNLFALRFLRKNQYNM